MLLLVEAYTAFIEPESKLGTLLGRGDVSPINSMHHQAIDMVADTLSVVAHSTDGVIEGIEDPGHPFFVGVQWHPEFLDSHTGLFEGLISAAKDSKESAH